MSFWGNARDAAGYSVGVRHPILAAIGPFLLRLAALVVVSGAAIAAWRHRDELPWWGWPLGGALAIALLRRAGQIGRRRGHYDWD